MFKVWNNWLKQLEKARLKNVQMLIDFYNGEHKPYLERYIKLDNESKSDFPFYESNITKKIINRISEVYKEAPVRYLNEKRSEKYEKITYLKDSRLKTVERQANLLGIVGVRPVVKVSGNELYFDYLIIRHFSAYLDGLDVVAVKYLIADDGVEQRYEYWTDEIHTILDSENIEVDAAERARFGITDTENPYGVIPFVWMRNDFIVDDFYNTAGAADDLVNANLHIDLMISEMAHKYRYQSFNQPVFIGVDTSQDIKIGYNFAVLLSDSDAKAISLQTNHLFADDIEAIKFQIDYINQLYGLKTQWAITGNVSGFSLIVQNMEHQDNIKHMKEVCSVWEKELYEMEKIVGSVEGLKVPDGEMRVDFVEVDLPLTIEEQNKKWEFEFQNGLASRADYLRAQNPDITDEQIKQKLEEIANENVFLKTAQQTEPTVSELFK
jgi:hypothetical protein